MVEDDGFETLEPVGHTGEQLVLDLEGFEGPIDALLALARQKTVDLIHISILKLADQYISFIEQARALRLEIAADYLVMAAWLAYLKSRLLLPAEDEDDEISGAELAEALAFQLRRLESMQQAGAKVMALPRLGMDIFARGNPEGVEVIRTPVYELSLYDLLKSYGSQQHRGTPPPLEILATELFSVDDALERLGRLLGAMPDWQTLMEFLPEGLKNTMVYRSAVAATFTASLELARDGQVELRQSGTFSPIFMRPVKKDG